MIAKSTLQGGKTNQIAAKKQQSKIVAGLKPKDLCGIPWMMSFALRDAGWYLRQDVIWAKRSCMPESVTDRCTKAHEYIFLLTKNNRYYYDNEAIKTPVSEAFANDSRWITGPTDKNIKIGYEDAMAQSPKMPHRMFAKSGNKQRKSSSERGCPEGTGKNQAGSVPWEGMTANRRSVWKVEDPWATWRWLYENMAPENFEPLWLKYLMDKEAFDDTWEISPTAFREAHFATFPTELPELCIKAGSSEHGCCSSCGKPYQSILEKQKGIPEHFNGSSFTKGKTIQAAEQNAKVGSGERTTTTTTTGWQPTCKCVDAGITPAIVIDPFSGAATTFLVAKKLNRNAIGIELNKEYINISDRRLKKELGMFYQPINDAA
jgi:hypothetical protein